MLTNLLTQIKTWMSAMQGASAAKTPEAFIEWLDEMTAQKGWTDDRLSREAGLPRSALRKIREGRVPRYNEIDRITQALSVSKVIAFRKAGLLPPGDDEITYEDWMYLLNQLPEEEQEDLRQIAEDKIKKRLLENQSSTT